MPYGFSELLALFLKFEKRLMILPLLVTTNTCKIGLKTEARAFGALRGVVRLVFRMSVLALAARLPLVDVETLSSDEPPLADFFGASRHERKLLAFTIGAVRLELFAGDLLIVFAPETAAEASRLGTDPETVIFGLRTPPSDVNAIHLRLLSMLELPRHHLGSARSRTYLFDHLKDCVRVIRLCQHLVKI